MSVFWYFKPHTYWQNIVAFAHMKIAPGPYLHFFWGSISANCHEIWHSHAGECEVTYIVPVLDWQTVSTVFYDRICHTFVIGSCFFLLFCYFHPQYCQWYRIQSVRCFPFHCSCWLWQTFNPSAQRVTYDTKVWWRSGANDRAMKGETKIINLCFM